MMLFDFNQQPEAVSGWTESHTGPARGSLGRSEQGFALFAGTLPPHANNDTSEPPACAAVWSPPLEYDLSDYNGLRMWVRGDGGRYGFLLRDTNFLNLIYRLNFVTETHQWTTITLPFSAFKPVGIHKRLRWLVPKLNPARLRGGGLVFGGTPESAPGAFALEIEHILVYRIEPFLARLPDEG